MSCREGLKLALVLAAAAGCQGKAEPKPNAAGSGSAAVTPAAPALQLTACAVADPRPSRMRFGFPSADDYGIPGPTAGPGQIGGVGSKGGGTGAGYGRLSSRTQPRIAVKTVEVTGALDKMIVRRYLRRQTTQFTTCYTTALAKTPKLEGTLTVMFELDKIGTVKTVRATGMTGALPACAVKVVEQTKFPSGEGGTNQIKIALVFTPQAVVASAAPAPVSPPTAWTPYAVARGQAPADPSAVDAMQAAIRPQLATLDACFGAANGSVRAMIEITADGHVQRARVGGLGLEAPEVCLARELQKLAITAPAGQLELACDFVRGAPQPWRVTREAYSVFEVDTTRILSPDGSSHAFTAPEDLGLPIAGGAYLVLAAPDAPGPGIERAVVHTSGGGVSVVAVTATGGPPVFAGMGPDLETTIDGAGNLGIAVTSGVARVCTDGADVTQTAPVIDPSALDRLIAAGLAACKTPCTTASVGVVGDYLGKDLVAVTAAARRAKLATIVAGQACP